MCDIAPAAMSSVLHLSILLCTLCFSTAEWCYQSQFSCNEPCNVPSKWGNINTSCAHNQQSPINIITSEVKPDLTLTAFSFVGYNQSHNISLRNTGHTAQFELSQSMRISGGGLPSSYKAIQFHLHWGSETEPGSEHTVDGRQFPMELHIVHMKENIKTTMDIEKDSSSIAALAFFFEDSPVDNGNFSTLIEAMGRVPNFNNTTTIIDFRLSSILPREEELGAYYRYNGSLTTPNCNEVVIWTVFQKRIPLQAVTNQMRFHSGEYMMGTFRPVQWLNGRKVYRSAAGSILPSVWLSVLCVLAYIQEPGQSIPI